GHESDLLGGLLEDDHPGIEPLLLTDRLGARACPAAFVDAGHRRDIGSPDSDQQPWSGSVSDRSRREQRAGADGQRREPAHATEPSVGVAEANWSAAARSNDP